MLRYVLEIGPARPLYELPWDELMVVRMTAVGDPWDSGLAILQGKRYGKVATDCGMSNDLGP
jgi:hypothetical protein